jgi:Lar family restriction alleviation protein
MNETNACPFCGSHDISDGEVLTANPNGTTTTQSSCNECGALGPEAGLQVGEVDYGSTKAIEAWNRRATPMQIPKEGQP